MADSFYMQFDNAIAQIKDSWKDCDSVFNLVKQMEVLGKNMKHLRGATDPDDRKKLRIVWQKAAQQYWDIVWAIVEAKIDYGPPAELTFDEAEQLFINFGHLYSDYTTPNEAIFDQLYSPAQIDMFQYNRLTDYLRESYALIFEKPYHGTSTGVSVEDKHKHFEAELAAAKTRRRMVVTSLFAKFDLAPRDQIISMLYDLEEGLADAVETDMRTRRVREAEENERKGIREHCRKYEAAEHTLWYLMDLLEKKLSKHDEQEEEPAGEAAAGEPAPEAPKRVEDTFDPFAEIGSDDPEPAPEPEAAKAGEHDGVSAPGDEEDGAGDDDSPTRLVGGSTAPRMLSAEEAKEEVDQSLKIIQNVLALHDRTRFLACMIVHMQNEQERWRMRVDMAAKKFKDAGIPARKLELREGLNNKKDFMTLCANQARVDSSPLLQCKGEPASMKSVGEVMMDLTPLDPDMLRASRIRMYGIPRVILVPGQGFGVYDWSDNSLIIPIFPTVSLVKAVSYALAAFRWDNDEERTLKDTFALLKQNKGKGIRSLQDQFSNDYFLWLSKERKGYRILPRDVSKWFKTFFKQKSGSGEHHQ